MDNFIIVFKGEIQAGKDKDNIAKMLANYLKIPLEKADLLFNGKGYILKKNLDANKALESQKNLALLGITTYVEKQKEKTHTVAPIDEKTKNHDSHVKTEQGIYCKHCGSKIESKEESFVKSVKNEFDSHIKNIKEINAIKNKDFRSSKILNSILSPKGLFVSSVFTITMFMVFGSFSGVPDCTDTRTTDLVKEITQEQIAKIYGNSIIKKIKVKVTSIKQDEYDKDIPKYFCSARITIAGPNGSNNSNITYTSEQADSKDGSFYVEVFGL